MQVLLSIRQEAPKVLNVTRVASLIVLRWKPAATIPGPALGIVEGDPAHFARLNCVLSAVAAL